MPPMSKCPSKAPAIPCDTGAIFCNLDASHEGYHEAVDYDLPYPARQEFLRKWNNEGRTWYFDLYGVYHSYEFAMPLPDEHPAKESHG